MRGKVDTQAGWGRPKRQRAISQGVAAVVTSILEQNIQYGTGVGARIDRPAAGKTGTNEKHEDAWFAGYTPDLATTVWVGYTRAGRVIDMLERRGVISGYEGSKPRQVLVGEGDAERFIQNLRERDSARPAPEPVSVPDDAE